MRASDYWIEENIEVEIFGETVSLEVRLTESGNIDAKLEQPVKVSEPPEFGGHDFEGVNESGTPVTLENTFITQTSTEVGDVTHTVKSISPQKVVIGNVDEDPFVGEEVTIEFDMLCFQQNQPLIDSFEDFLLEREDWVAFGTSYEDTEERIEYIKEYHTPVRTGRIEFQQFVNGPPEVQFQRAEDHLLKMVELISFLQGVGPAPIRARITEVDGESIDDGCVWLLSGYQSDMGHIFKGEKLLWHNDLRDFLDEAYDEYVNRLREKYALNIAISWYLDSLNTTRTVDSRFSSLVNGIEVMAKRHSEHGPRHSETKDKIQYLVNELNVETTDLARYSPTFNDDKIGDENGYQAYFYNRSRQHVVHGEHFNAIDFRDLYMDYEAALVLFRRLLRNQLIDSENMSQYSSICDLEIDENQTKFF